MRKLTKSKYRALSEFCNTLAVLFLGSLVIPIITNSFAIVQLPVVVLGIVLTIISLYLSLYCAEKGKL